MPIFASLYQSGRGGIGLRGRTFRAGCFLCCLLQFGAGTGWSKGAEKPVTISLTDLGLQGTGGRPQTPGNTLATVNFVGDHHLLVTFPVRRLMKRLPDCDPDDEDRMIDAVLVDVPSGKVAARTSWRVHDSGQYLWELGRGRFAVRVRERLMAVAPLENLSTEHPFEEKALVGFDRQQIVGVLVSAEADLLTVETRQRRIAPPAKPGMPELRVDEGPVAIHFFRLEDEPRSVRALSAGRVMSKTAIEVPMTGDGYLDTSEEKRGKWVFDYIAHAGKKTELAPYDTTCYPQAKFVSRSEFIAFGCRGSSDKIEIGGFDMKGREMWQQNFFEPFAHPTFSFAPGAGRFALGRALTAVSTGYDPSGGQMTGQDVVVMQAQTGKQIFHTVVMPAQRTGQNFALSADGLEVAVIRATMVEVHRLPEPSGADHRSMKEAREFALERATGAIVLPTRSRVAAAAVAEPMGKPEEPRVALKTATEAVSPAKPGVPAKPVEHTVQVGDAPDDGPRKAPTLYGAGEKGQPQ